MIKNSKGKKWSLKRKINTLVILVPLALILIAALIFSPLIIYFCRFTYTTADIDGHLIDTKLTMEQKLEDLDYMYEIVCLNNPNREQIEKTCKISYDDIYNRYRQLVMESKTDYEYFSLMSCFLGVLPGQHNVMMLPDYKRNAVGFLMSEIYASQSMRDYSYSWHEEFRDEVKEYRGHGLLMFRYFDGRYYGVGANIETINFINDYVQGELLTIDGKNPKDMCFEFLLRESPHYDEGNDCFFRPNLYFNDAIGIPHTVEILMPDGNVVTTTVYEAAGFEIAITDGLAVYPELRPVSSGTSSASDTNTAGQNAPKSYTITEDPDRKLVYVNSTSCDSSEGQRLAEDLSRALTEADADTVIIDMRSNGGGETSFCNMQVLPVLFSHDLEYPTDVVGYKNQHTKHLCNDLYYRFFFERPIKVTGDKFYIHEDFNVEGRAVKNYKIYLLTSSKTFSSADLMTCLCKEYDNATVVGTNTGGEGICGTPLKCYLPNSRFMFNYTATANVDVPGNNYLGTSPDIYIPQTAGEFFKKQELTAQGFDADSYEVRLTYDQTLIYVVGLADDAD